MSTESNEPIGPSADERMLAMQAEQVRNAPGGSIFSTLWRNKFIATDATNIEEFRTCLAHAVATLDRWILAGVTLDPTSGIEDDYAVFQTDSKEVALAEGFQLDQRDDDDPDWIRDDCPLDVGGDFTYVLRADEIPASPEALVEAVAAWEKELHDDDPDYEMFDAKRLNKLSGLTVLDVCFDQHLLRGKSRIKRIGDGEHDMTYADIMFRLHRSVAKNKLGDHVYFEGWEYKGMDEDGVPQFVPYMGS
jgi:hypothetical protein